LPEVRLSLLTVGLSAAFALPFSPFLSVFTGLQDYGFPTVLTVISRLLSAVALMVLLLLHGGLFQLALAIAGCNIATAIAQFHGWRRYARERVAFSFPFFDRKSARQLTKYSGVLMIWTLGGLCVSGLDLVIVGHFDYRNTGFYAIGASATSFMLMVVAGLLGPLLPAISSLQSSKTPSQIGDLTVRATRYGTLLLCLLGLPLLIGAYPLLSLWVGHEYALRSAVFLQVLVIGNAIRQLGYPYSIFVVATGRQHLATGAAIAACIMLRPDGGLLLSAVGLYLGVLAGKQLFTKNNAWKKNLADVLVAGVIVAALALAPLVPWTIRNFRTFHRFQPLAPRYANDADELIPRGFIRWVKTWMIDYASVEEIYWSVPDGKIDTAKLPSRAIDDSNPAEKAATLAVIADFNDLQDITPELDARFGKIAAERVRAHPVRYYFLLPVLRVADMWLRPRTEILPPDVRWWEFNDDPDLSVMAVGFGLLGLAYVGTALLGLARRPSGIRWAGLLVTFLLVRSAFLGTMENPEPRYTLECYPVVILCAAAYLAKRDRAAAI